MSELRRRWIRALGMGGPPPNRDGMIQHDDGEWVLHTDHLAAVEAVRAAERDRIRQGTLAYYAVAPKAAEPILRIIEEGQ